MQTLLQNLRFSLRMLWKSPGLTLTVLLTLALGIGANTAIFTVDYATLLAPLPYPQPNQLVMVWSKIQDVSQRGLSRRFHRLEATKHIIPGPQCLDWRRLQYCNERSARVHPGYTGHARLLQHDGK